MIRLPWPLLAALAVLAAGAAYARPATAEPTRATDEVEDGAPTPSEVTVRGARSGGFVSQATIESSPRTITDAASLIEQLPGVHVRRLGADDSFATLSVRGMSSTQVAVYLAGIPLSGGADPTLDLATLPLWPGVRARVYRSFAPAALGRGSLGGTLTIDPPSARSAPRTEVWSAVGSYGQLRLRVADVSGSEDGVRIATGVSASRSDDDFSYLDPAATIARGHDVYARRLNAGHADAAGLVSVALPVRLGPGKRGALTMTTMAQARRQELPGTIQAPTPWQRFDSSRLVSGLELTVPLGDGTFGVRGWARREGLTTRDSEVGARGSMGPTYSDDVILATGTSVGWRWRRSSAEVEARVDGSLERFAPGTWIDAGRPRAARRSNVGLALDGAWQPSGRPRGVAVKGSARADAWFDGSETGESSSYLRPTGNLGVEAPVGPVTLASHAGIASRPASFVERFGNRGFFIGDPDLRPESAFTVDAGGAIDRRWGPLTLHAEAAGFMTWAEDLITYVAVGAYGRQKATNIGAARFYGVEALVRASLWGFEVRLSETALATVNESACRYTVGGSCERPDLPGRPAHDLVFDLAYGYGPARIRYGFDLVSGTHTDLEGRPESIVPARLLHSAGAYLDVPGAPGLSAALELRNLLDTRVAEYPGAFGPVRAPIGDIYNYPLPGRRFMISLRWVTDGRAPRAR